MRLLLLGALLACSERALQIPVPSEASDAARSNICDGNSLCPPDQYCDYPPGECVIFESHHDCVSRPASCPADSGTPVCGCDHRTYPSECELHRAGVAELLADRACP